MSTVTIMKTMVSQTYYQKNREGCNCRFRRTPRTEARHKVQGSVEPMFAAGLPFPVPEILEFILEEENLGHSIQKIFQNSAILLNSGCFPWKI